MIKKIATVIFLQCLSLSLFAKAADPLCAGVDSPAFVTGDGSVDNPYLICNRDQYKRLSAETDLLSQNFKMGADLDFSGVIYKVIGNKVTPFTGSFDGADYTLSAVSVDFPRSASYVGLFGFVRNGVIRNLLVNNLTLPPVSSSQVGGLIGQAEGTIVSRVSIKGLDMFCPDYSGGLIGQAKNSFISNCSVQGQLNHHYGTDAAGGLIGYAAGSNITESFTDVKMINLSDDPWAVSSIGGLIGYTRDSFITQVYARGDIDYSASHPTDPKPRQIGGLIGTMYNSFLNFAYYAGKITIDARELGGVAGFSDIAPPAIPVPPTVFWDTQLSTINFSPVGEGFDTATLTSSSFWLSRGFNPNLWNLVDGQYPTLVETP